MADQPPNVLERIRNAPTKLRRLYKHKPIDENHARLLILHPCPKGMRNDPIRASLSEVKFEDLNRKFFFEALSYHWGALTEEPRAILLQDQKKPGTPRAVAPQSPSRTGRDLGSVAEEYIEKQSQFFILPNLYEALRHLRKDDDSYVMLWIDAICINQDDLEEKQKQVAKMHLIYQRATKVLIWLGISDDCRARAMNFVKEVVDLQKLNSLILDDSRVDDWNALFQLTQQSWFSRRWVIQELALAKTAQVHCGDRHVDWADLRDAIGLFARHFEDIRPLFRRSEKYNNDHYALGDMEALEAKVLVDRVNNFVRESSGGTLQPIFGLEYLVSKLSCFHSSDPRDTIHALRNIAKETSGSVLSREDQAPPPPDYNKTLLEVYSDFVRWVATTTESIDIICRKWALPEKEVEHDPQYPDWSILPSWIQVIPKKGLGIEYQDDPTESARRINGDCFVGLPGEQPYRASHSMKAEIVFSQNIPTTIVEEPEEVDNSFRDLDERDWQSNDESHKHSSCRSATQDSFLSHNESRKLFDTPNRKRKRSSYEPDAVRERAAKTMRNAQHLLGDTLGSIAESATFKLSDGSDPTAATQVSTSVCPSDSSKDKDTDDLLDNIKKGQDASIRVKGMQIGAITYATNAITDGVIPPEAVQKLKKGTQKPVPDKLWRALVAERGTDGRSPPAWWERACRTIIMTQKSAHINTRQLLSKNIPGIAKEYLKRVEAVIWNRVFFEIGQPDHAQGISQGRLHGFGPELAQRNDIACILYGCSVPCILRPIANSPPGQQYYKFIGESYIYGLMDGDAVSRMTKQDLMEATREFWIL